MPVALARALPMAALTGMTGASPTGFAPSGTVTVVGVGEEDLGSGDVGKGRNAVIPEGGIHDGRRFASITIRSKRVVPIPWAIPPSSCARACMGLMTVPASKACTLPAGCGSRR